MKKKKDIMSTIGAGIPAVVIVIAIVFLFFMAVSSLDGAGSEQAMERLEEALRRGAVTCYANEGIYPPTLEYLTDNYDVKIDEERYYVHYEVFASNIMPEITVIEK